MDIQLFLSTRNSRPPLGPNAKSAQQQQDLRDFPQPFFLEESQALWPKKVLGTEKAFCCAAGRWSHLFLGSFGLWRRRSLELVGGCCVTVDFDISYVIFVFFWGGVLWRNAGILVEKMIKPRKKKKQQHAYF